MRARTRPPCPERRKRRRKAASKTMSKTAVAVQKMSKSMSTSDIRQGGPIPLQNKQASYYLTPGRNPLLQFDPYSITGGSIPRANTLGPSTLESNTEALQTFLGQRQSAVMGGGQLPKQMMKRTVGSNTSATGNILAGQNQLVMQFANYESGTSKNIAQTQNMVNNTAPAILRGISMLNPTTPSFKSNTQLTDNNIYGNIQPNNLLNQFTVEDNSGDAMDANEIGEANNILGSISNDNVLTDAGSFGEQATAPALQTTLVGGRLYRTPIPGRSPIAGRTRSKK